MRTSNKKMRTSNKNCRNCGKSDVEFRKNRRICRDCQKVQGCEYRRKNKDKSEKWHDDNRERMRELQHNWYLRNKEKINKKFNKRYKEEDGDFKRIRNHKRAVSRMVRGGKSSIYVNCDRDMLIDWLEFCFDDNDSITLENYGIVWTIDHVVPLETISKGENEKLVMHWMNVVPVVCMYNLEKNKHLDSEQLQKHLERVKIYCEVRKLQEPEYEELLARHLVAGNP